MGRVFDILLVSSRCFARKSQSLFAELVGCFIFMMLVGNLSAIMLSESAIEKKVRQVVHHSFGCDLTRSTMPVAPPSPVRPQLSLAFS